MSKGHNEENQGEPIRLNYQSDDGISVRFIIFLQIIIGNVMYQKVYSLRLLH